MVLGESDYKVMNHYLFKCSKAQLLVNQKELG
jgi:hypothetical protein